MEIKLPYVVAIRKRGGRKGDRTLYYWQRKGFPIRRLPDDPTSPEFIALARRLNAEAAGEKKAAAGKPEGSFGWLVDKYLASPDTKALARKTIENYSYFLRRLEKQFGHCPIAELDRQTVYDIRDSLAATPSAANLAISTLRGLLTWALDRRLVTENVASKPRQIGVKPRQAVWAPADEAAFLACADETMRLAFMIGAHSAQRLADVCAMTWGQYNGRTIKLRQQKTGTLLEVPCHAALREALDAAPRRSLMILTTPTGKPFRPSNFNLRWAAIAKASGIHGRVQFRDLRRTAMVRLGEAGANAIQIAAISGHEIGETQRILETYIPRNLAMAEGAIVALERRKPGTAG